jgi:HSP90 family molecular chaperone
LIRNGEYEIAEADNVAVGTKIVINLREDSKSFSDKSTVLRIIQKYSQFVGHPVLLNGVRANTFEPLWLKDRSQIKDEEMKEFYNHLYKDINDPIMSLAYSIDSPLSIRSLLFIPDLTHLNDYQLYSVESSLNLYTRKVLVKSQAKELLPEWLRFVRGVVDCEDIPLNLSRELLQNNGLIMKLRDILTKRIIKWLNDQSGTHEYGVFWGKMGTYIKEGIVQDSNNRNQLLDLVRFESSLRKPKELVSLADYVSRMPEDQKDIYYFVGHSYESSLTSPYIEPFLKKGYEVNNTQSF